MSFIQTSTQVWMSVMLSFVALCGSILPTYAQPDMWDITVLREEMLETDHYLINTTINIEAPVDGDLSAVATSLTISEEIQGDVMAFANKLNINAPVFDDVRAFANSVVISEGVGSDVLLFASDVSITSNAPIGQNLRVAGNTISVQSDIGQTLDLQGQSIALNSVVQGNTTLSFNTISLGEDTRFLGDLEYSAPTQQPELEALVQGEVNYLWLRTANKRRQGMLNNVGRGRTAPTVASIITLALLRAFLLPGYFRRSGSVLHYRPLVSLGRGAASYILLPLLAVLLMLAQVTASLGGFIFALRIFTLLWTPVVIVFVAASLLEYYVGDRFARSHRIILRVISIVAFSFLVSLLPLPALIILWLFAVGVVAQNDVHLMALWIFSLPKKSLAEQELDNHEANDQENDINKV